MSNIELVIKIPEEKYLYAKAMVEGEKEKNPVVIAIGNGTPLPKGHGRLIDEKDLSLMTVHMVDGVFVCDAPTIIEADTESEE